MPGVRLLGQPEEFCWMTVWPRRVAKQSASSVSGHDGRPNLGQAGGAKHEAGWMSSLTVRAAGRALKVTQSNKRMHATADTTAVMFCGTLGAARDARR